MSSGTYTEADIERLIPPRVSVDPTAVTCIKQAWAFAQRVHAGQRRRSGEPYTEHLFQTTKMLGALDMGAPTLIAGILHDTLEDTQTCEADLAEAFGTDVAFLVAGLTKLKREKSKQGRHEGTPYYANNLRKLLLAAAQDVRILIIKLCDRLHNMQTLSHMPAETQKRVSLETRNVYVPVAERLGMHTIKRELEDLAFAYLEPDSFKKACRLFKKCKSEHEISIIEATATLQLEQAIHARIPFRIEQRDKGICSFYQKLERKEWELSQINDIITLQVIVPNADDCYIMLGKIHGLWHPIHGKFKDYIAFPKPNGFQCLRTTVGAESLGILEIQIYSDDMYERAKYGFAVLLARNEY
ncbi:MAG: HD domain-containing protein [Candidatus Paceibacterota bacterium]|jgi:GTP pyrophosphokinase